MTTTVTPLLEAAICALPTRPTPDHDFPPTTRVLAALMGLHRELAEVGLPDEAMDVIVAGAWQDDAEDPDLAGVRRDVTTRQRVLWLLEELDDLLAPSMDALLAIQRSPQPPHPAAVR